jgi:hypothetical protein
MIGRPRRNQAPGFKGKVPLAEILFRARYGVTRGVLAAMISHSYSNPRIGWNRNTFLRRRRTRQNNRSLRRGR